MTDKQPEALRLANEFKLCIEYDSIPSINDIAKAEAELRRLHTYCQELESQVILDCMTHVQTPAEIEHVAGDVSKSGVESNMAQQPAPSAAEPSCEALADFQEGQWWVNELDAVASHPVGAQIYVTADMKRAVAVVHHFLRSARKHEQPSTTPQADSQPEDENDAHNFAICQHFDHWLLEKGALLTPHSEESDGPMAPALNWIVSVEAMVAARAPADSVTAPAGGEIDRLRAALVYVAYALHDTPKYMLAEGITLIDGDTVRVSRDGWTVEASVNPARAAPPAQAADSVLEDAALLDFIAQHPEMSLRHRKGKWAFVGFTNYEYEMLPSLREAIRAARKQGGE